MKSRRLSTVLFCCLIAVFCGLGGYIVFALTEVTLTATNKIIFDAPNNVFYIASAKVYYEGESSTPIESDAINHSGDLAQQNLEKNKMTFGNAIIFTSEKRTIVYEITISNYTEQDVTVTLNVPENKDGYYTNSLAGESSVTIEKFQVGGTIKSTTFFLTCHMTSAEHSFKFDNSFTIDLSISN